MFRQLEFRVRWMLSDSQPGTFSNRRDSLLSKNAEILS